MREKFNEKILASTEEIEKPIESVDAYVTRNRNQPKDKKRNRARRYANSRSALSARQRIMMYRATLRNGGNTKHLSSSEMRIDFDLDDAIERRRVGNVLRKALKKSKGTGNRILLVESANYDDKGWTHYVKNVMRDPTESFVQDPLRGRSAKYYRSYRDSLITPDITSRLVNHSRQQRRGSNKSAVYVSGRSPYVFMFSTAANVPSDSDYGETSEWVLLKPNKSMFKVPPSRGTKRSKKEIDFNKYLWHKYMLGGTHGKKDYEPTILQDVVFSDHFHQKIAPVYENITEGEQSSPKKNYVTSRSVYNFYNEKYEDFLTESNVPHNALPNLYNFLSEVISDYSTEDVKEQNTLGGTIEGENPFLRTTRGMFKSAVKQSTLQEYLKKYGMKFLEAKKAGKIEKIITKSSNVIFPLLQIKEMIQADYKKEFFPMYNEIEFTIDSDSGFVDILETAKMEDEFTKNIIQLILANQNSTMEFVENTSSPNGDRKNDIVQKKVWDLSQDIFSSKKIDEEVFEKNITMLGDDTALNNLSHKRNMFFFNSIVSLAFSAKIQEYIRHHFRTYEEMVNGEKAHSEVVVYRVAKYLGPPTDTPVKNYFFLNTSDLETFRFVDTQVKVNEEYSYEIYSYDLVIGNSYSYTDSKMYQDSAAVKVNQRPSLKIIENKISETSNLILSEPPTIPDINVYPFFGTDDKIGFNFNGSVGNRLMTPIVFSEQEQKRIDKLKKSQNREQQGKVWYSHDGINRFYEVYRSTTPPTSPMDFLNEMRIRTPNTSFVDTIEPNTTYYYLFRAIDNHGNVSNPSEVMVVTIVKDKFIYPIISNYSYETAKKKTRETKKDLKKYMRISPILSNLLVDDNRTDVDAESASKVVKATMGPKGTSVWGKKFKVRVTSKNSGKKMDLNFKFTQEFEKPTDEVI
jgi:hypothetical protein